MSEFIAALPMYDWPETRRETDAEWARLRDLLRSEGIDAPERLTRRNGDMPPVPGGVRGPGKTAALDPASLPPDDLDLATLWRHPRLLLAQTCWGPMEQGLAAHVQLIGQPDYSAYEGGDGEFYSSAIVMRGSQRTPGCPASSAAALIPLDLLRGRRFAYNGPESMSGFIALSRDLEAAGESLAIFSDRVETGAHRASAIAVAEGGADVCAIDCRSWALLKRHEPRAAELQVVGWTAKRKGLPYIASAALPADTIEALRRTLCHPISRASSG